MRQGKVILWVLLVLLLIVVGGGAALHFLSSTRPENYQPATLTPAQREKEKYQFYKRLMDFNNEAQGLAAFEYVATQDEMNRFLASLDEIAAMRRKVKPRTVNEAMQKLGLSGPAVSLADGAITLMIRADEYEKILSLELALETLDDGRIVVKLRDVRLGVLPLPRSVASEQLTKLKAAMARTRNGQSVEAGGLTTDGMASVLASLVMAIDSEPLPNEYKFDKKWIRIERITIADGKIVLSCQPFVR